MQRSVTLLLTLCLVFTASVVAVVLSGCGPDLRAQTALAKGNAALAAYATAEDAIAKQIAQAAAVQPTPDGVKPGLALLAKVKAAMPARQQAAATAKAQFVAFKAAASDEKQKGYADRAIALADGLLRLDAVTISLTADMTELYQDVAKNSSNTDRVVALADSVTKGQTAYDKARADVKALSDAADQYYQANLAVTK